MEESNRVFRYFSHVRVRLFGMTTVMVSQLLLTGRDHKWYSVSVAHGECLYRRAKHKSNQATRR
jgi:hypothetical protein